MPSVDTCITFFTLSLILGGLGLQAILVHPLILTALTPLVCGHFFRH